MWRGRYLVLGSLLFCLLSSCVWSDNPLSDPLQSEQDVQLYGTWSGPEAGKLMRIDRGSEKHLIDPQRDDVEPGLMCMTVTQRDADGTLQPPESGYFFSTRIGDQRFMNLIVTDERTRKFQGYLLLKYRVDAFGLVLGMGDPNAAADVIEAGRLKGTIERDKNGRVLSARFTDSTEKIAAFLADKGAAVLFPDKNARGEDLRTLYARVP